MTVRTETSDRRNGLETTRVKLNGKTVHVQGFCPEDMAKRLKARRKRKLSVEEREQWQETKEFERDFQ